MTATHAISKILQNSQNRIPMELNQNLYISRIGINHCISFNFLNQKNRPREKVIPIFNPGIQPTYDDLIKNLLDDCGYYDYDYK